MMNDESYEYISRLPTELLLSIFTSLTARELIVCRRVCSRWKQIVDGMSRSEALWRMDCRRDFRNIYKMARLKAKPGVLWFHIYRSLSLWPKLSQARERGNEFAACSEFCEEIRDFKILRDGVIGVNTVGGIVYYDIETLEKSKRTSITGNFLKYTENDDFIVLLSYRLHLFVISKAVHDTKYERNDAFGDVKTFILVKKKVYYVNLNDDIYVYQLDDDIRHQRITHSGDEVMCLGYTNRLHVLTFDRTIYSVCEDQLIFTRRLGVDTNLLHQLREYNFLECMAWDVYIHWMYVLRHTIPEGPLRDIVVVRTYGHVVFVGSYWGVLRIYYAPYNDGEFDLYNSEPIKQYNFTERYDFPMPCMCPIVQIDVMEGEAGHTVIVAMPQKIAVLEFTHCFKRTASVATLPYNDPQKVKVLKIEEPQ